MITDDDNKPEGAASEAVTFADACRMFLDVVRTSTLLARAPDLTVEERERFNIIAKSVANRFVLMCDPNPGGAAIVSKAVH